MMIKSDRFRRHHFDRQTQRKPRSPTVQAKTLSKVIWRAALVLSAVLLQSCGIPTLTTREADAPLPEHFDGHAHDTTNAASINWKDFFADPNLVHLIDTAVANNKEINIMLQRISVAENEIQARRGEYLPFVKFGAGVDVEKVGRFTRNGAVEETLEITEGKRFPTFLANYQFGLFSSWELDVWKKLRNATQVAVLEYMATIEGRNFLLTNLVAEVAHSYYELIALDNQLDNLERNIQLQLNGLDVVKLMQLYARANALAVKRYEAEVKKNQSRQYEIKQQISVVENRINTLLGSTPQPITRASAGFMEIKPKMVQAGIPSQLLQNRPDIKNAELELAAAKLNIEVAKASFYPSFAIKAGVGYQAFDPKYLVTTPESLAVALAGDLVAPLVNRNAIIAEYKNANAKQVQAAYDYEQKIINAYSEVANQLSNMDNLDKNYQLKSKQVAALTDSIDVASQLFKSARADYLEVLLTQRDALEAKSELIETKQKQISAMVDLYKALGGGWR